MKAHAIIFLVSSIFAAVVTLAARSRDSKPSWDIQPREQAALQGIEKGYASLADALAPIITEAKTREAVVRFLAPNVLALDAAAKDLDSSVHSRLGVASDVALVVSGASWVRR